MRASGYKWCNSARHLGEGDTLLSGVPRYGVISGPDNEHTVIFSHWEWLHSNPFPALQLTGLFSVGIPKNCIKSQNSPFVNRRENLLTDRQYPTLKRPKGTNTLTFLLHLYWLLASTQHPQHFRAGQKSPERSQMSSVLVSPPKMQCYNPFCSPKILDFIFKLKEDIAMCGSIYELVPRELLGAAELPYDRWNTKDISSKSVQTRVSGDAGLFIRLLCSKTSEIQSVLTSLVIARL